MEPNRPILISFVQSLNLFSKIKLNISIKGSGTCIDLVLINRDYYFKHPSTFQMSLSDHHHLIYSMGKPPVKQDEAKLYKHCNYNVMVRLLTRVFKLNKVKVLSSANIFRRHSQEM